MSLQHREKHMTSLVSLSHQRPVNVTLRILLDDRRMTQENLGHQNCGL